MSGVTHYDVLGVRPGATAAEIRTAYVAKARRVHPDVAGAAGDATMRTLNSAWSVLGDPEARTQYDRSLDQGTLDEGTLGEPVRPNVNRPVETPFVPYHAVDEDDDDEWRYVEDETDPETAPSAAVQLAPIALVLVGLVFVAGGALLRALPIAAFGGIFIALGFVGFLIVPLTVMAKASTVEHRRDREREQRRDRS